MARKVKVMERFFFAFIGFLFAMAVLLPEILSLRRENRMLRKLNEQHNWRMLACKTGMFRISSVIRWVETKER